jgi:hypothetical protein
VIPSFEIVMYPPYVPGSTSIVSPGFAASTACWIDWPERTLTTAALAGAAPERDIPQIAHSNDSGIRSHRARTVVAVGADTAASSMSSVE